MVMKKGLLLICFFIVLLVGCATTAPVRPALKEDLKIPVGKIEGNQFIGVRYPFNITVPSHWKMSTEFPDFMGDLGYNKPSPTDKEQTELYAFHPESKSSIHFDLTPAGRYVTFDQEKIERLVTGATGSLKSEIEEDYGKDVKVEVGPTEPISLKGVPFAAKKYAIYTAKGLKREQGWIYGFTEPYQIFILYVILEREGSNDRQDIRKILDSFEVIPKK
jgi:hypothetical protein